MAVRSWLQGLKAILSHDKQVQRRRGSSRRSYIPFLEACEERNLPSTFTVLNLNDSGLGSLRAAVDSTNANPGADTIAFAAGLHGTIKLTSGELLLTDSVMINGSGADRLSVSGNNTSRVFDMTSGLDITIKGLTVTHGYALEQAGGILNQGSNLTLSGDILSQNEAFVLLLAAEHSVVSMAR